MVNEGEDESATRTDATCQRRNQAMRATLLYHMCHKKAVVRAGIHALYISMTCQKRCFDRILGLCMEIGFME